QESEEKFRLLSAQSLLGIVIFQANAVKYANQAAADILEIPLEDLMQWTMKGFESFIHPEYLSFVKDRIREQLAGEEGRIPHFSIPIAIKAGRAKWIEVYSKAINFGGKRAIFVTAIDITERKEADDRFRVLSELNRAILATSFDAIAVLDMEGLILFTNSALVELSGYSREELLGIHLSKITIGAKFVFHLIESAKKEHRIINLETTFIPRRAPPVPVELSSGLIAEEEKILVVFHDLRVEKELSEEIKFFREFAEDYICISLFKMGSKGAEVVITEQFPFAEDSEHANVLAQMGVYYLTALGQGNSLNTGLFGPLPVAGVPDYVSLAYAFVIKDPTFKDPRAKEQAYAFFVLVIPEMLVRLFTNRVALSKIFEKELGNLSMIQEIDLSRLKTLKHHLLSFEKNID
ncbi:MAG: PAS domain-containing protein, partial [Candidatus Hodarchaeales archaeon]